MNMNFHFSRRSHLSTVLSVVLFLALSWSTFGLSGAQTKITLISDKSEVTAGETFDVGIYLQMPVGWHTYHLNPGDSGSPTSIVWQLPTGWSADPLRWPAPLKIEEDGLVMYGYRNEVVLLARIHSPQNLTPGQTVDLRGKVEWLECKEACVPGQTEVHLAIPTGKISKNSTPETRKLIDRFRRQVPNEKIEASGTENVQARTKTSN